MGVQALEHVTIRCAQRQRTRDFYVELLGLSEGERPDFPFRGHWLYLGGMPVIHLVEAADTGGAWGREIERVAFEPDAQCNYYFVHHIQHSIHRPKLCL